jgi:hypothetical protein
MANGDSGSSSSTPQANTDYLSYLLALLGYNTGPQNGPPPTGASSSTSGVAPQNQTPAQEQAQLAGVLQTSGNTAYNQMLLQANPWLQNVENNQYQDEAKWIMQNSTTPQSAEKMLEGWNIGGTYASTGAQNTGTYTGSAGTGGPGVGGFTVSQMMPFFALIDQMMASKVSSSSNATWGYPGTNPAAPAATGYPETAPTTSTASTGTTSGTNQPAQAATVAATATQPTQATTAAVMQPVATAQPSTSTLTQPAQASTLSKQMQPTPAQNAAMLAAGTMTPAILNPQGGPMTASTGSGGPLPSQQLQVPTFSNQPLPSAVNLGLAATALAANQPTAQSSQSPLVAALARANQLRQQSQPTVGGSGTGINLPSSNLYGSTSGPSGGSVGSNALPSSIPGVSGYIPTTSPLNLYGTGYGPNGGSLGSSAFPSNIPGTSGYMPTNSTTGAAQSGLTAGQAQGIGAGISGLASSIGQMFKGVSLPSLTFPSTPYVSYTMPTMA